MTQLTEHARRNRAHWTVVAKEYAKAPERNWSREPNWGCWGKPERELGVLGDVAGKDVLDLGCGTAYWSAWLARLGARPVGVDVTPAQLETARRMQREFELEFPLVEANAEDVPLPDRSFDLVLSEYGASLWCDPYLWVPEASRLLRPGGELVFLTNGVISMLCVPDAQEAARSELLRPYFGLHRVEWSFEDSVEFHLGHGDWIRLLRANEFDVLDLIELQAPLGTPDPPGLDVPTVWAHRWPAEEIWKGRKRRSP
jgi:SAM-dependent methyltransferase